MPSAKADAIIESMSADAESTPDAGAASPPAADASGVDSASADEGVPGTEPPAAAASPEATNPALLQAELDAKLEHVRDRWRSIKLSRQAKETLSKAEQDRQAAAEERSKWEAARKDYRKGLEALGLKPQQVYEEMTRQAIEDGTPEAQIRRMQEAWKSEMEQTVGPLQQTVEELKKELQRRDAEGFEQRFETDFRTSLDDTKYENLRDEYEDAQIFQFARALRDDRQLMHANAKRLGVQLRDPGGRYTMREILDVLQAQQDEHERTKQQRRAARTAARASQAPEQAPSASPTVNGTAEKRNAGAPLGNDIATARASSGKPRLTRAERVRRLSGGG